MKSYIFNQGRRKLKGRTEGVEMCDAHLPPVGGGKAACGCLPKAVEHHEEEDAKKSKRGDIHGYHPSK